MAFIDPVLTNFNENGWDDCDHPLSRLVSDKPSVKQILSFKSVDGIKIGLLKHSGPGTHRRQYIKDLNIIIQPPYNDECILPYTPNEESNLPPSFVLAAQNELSYERMISLQESVHWSLPYFFYGAQMFPSILCGTARMNKSLTYVAKMMTPAKVHDFNRHALRGPAWPAAVQSPNPADHIISMLVFGISGAAQAYLNDFQGGSSELRTARANFTFNDGRLCTMDCKMYVHNP